MALIITNSYAMPTTHAITYGATTNVDCAIGDTLKFDGAFVGDYVVIIDSEIGVNSNIVYSYPFYLGYYIIAGGETSYSILDTTHTASTGSINFTTTTNISEIFSNKAIAIFPNPFIDILTISVDKETKVNIFASDGRLILTDTIYGGKKNIDFTNFSSGIYFIGIENSRRKIIKI